MAPSSHKALVAQFIQLTGCSERTAQRFLKASGYKLNEAIDAYFNAGAGGGSLATSSQDGQLDKMFESLRVEGDHKDALGVDSTMTYLSQELKVNLENAAIFVPLEIVQAPSLGEITRRGYIDGWKATGVSATRQAHAAHVRSLLSALSQDPIFFKKVYRHAFVVGKEPDQKSLSLENAQIYWSMLFTAPGWEWKTASHNWLRLWDSFLKEKWTRTVNRDMWNMTFEFALKTKSDETLSFWSEDGAWPSVIDDFVHWCRQRGIGKAQEEIAEMEVDQ